MTPPAVKVAVVRFLLSLALISIVGLNAATPTLTHQVHSHLLIGDNDSALELVSEALRLYPRSKEAMEVAILAYAKTGQDAEMSALFEKYRQIFPNAFDNKLLLEEMAWGVIDKGASHPSPSIRLTAMIAGRISNSQRGVDHLYLGLHDSNSAIRLLSAELSKGLRDQKLQEKISDMITSEKNFHARLKAIEVSGAMRATQAIGPLTEVLNSRNSTIEEKGLATASLVQLIDVPSKETLAQLVNSPREGLRLLACEIIAAFSLDQHASLLVPLLKDHSKDVRMVALQAIALTHTDEIDGVSLTNVVRPLMQDPQKQVAVVASWLMMVKGDKQGERLLIQLANSDDEKTRQLAAGCLKSSGRFGVGAMRITMTRSQDPYVQLNTALGLIGQGVYNEAAVSQLNHHLQESQDRWMWKKQGIFRYLAKSDVPFREDIPQFPEILSQLTRLEVLQILSIQNHPRAEEALRAALRERGFGVSGAAVQLLLSEGGEDSLEVVRSLVDDPDEKIALQATIILAHLGRETEVVGRLENYYESAPRQTKEQILESLGGIGSHKSMPFLVGCLLDPHLNLRLIAASSIIQCLNH